MKKRIILLLALLTLAIVYASDVYLFKGKLLDQMTALLARERAATTSSSNGSAATSSGTDGQSGPINKIQQEANAMVPPSPWIEAEKKRYLTLLTTAKPDVVVLPFQIPKIKNQYGVDLPGRMVMAYSTAQRIASGGRLKVADVELVARAVGEPRHFSRDDAIKFGRAIGAKIVVYGEASHDGAGHLSVTISSIPLPTGEAKVWAKSDIGISDENTPELAYDRSVDEAIPQLGFKQSKPLDVKVYSASNKPLMETPLGAINDASATPADGIWLQELIGSLFPDQTERARQRVFERALAGVEYLSQDSPDYRLLKARALVRLDRRVAALAVFGNSASTPEEQAFVGFLNGNVPEMEKAVAQIKRPLPKLIAELELVWVKSHYDIDNNALKQIAERLAKTVPKEWGPGIFWNVTGLDLWNVGQTIPIKLVMDAYFPVKGYSAGEIVRGKELVGPSSDQRSMIEIEGAPLAHANKVLEQIGVDWCCNLETWKPQPYQYLNLLAAHAEGMLLRDVDFTANIQGRRQEGLQLADLIDEVVFQRGSIELKLRKARLLMRNIEETQSQDKHSILYEQLYQEAKRVRQWNVSDAGIAAEVVYYELRGAQTHLETLFKRPAPFAYPAINDFQKDFPQNYRVIATSGDYITASEGVNPNISILERACGYTQLVPAPCEVWRQKLEANNQIDAARKVEKEQLVDRFHGNPKHTELLIAALKTRGDIEGAVTVARENIKIKRDAWESYKELGDLYISQGKFKETAEAYLSYPVFQNPGQENTVGITNRAEAVAYELARRGAVKEARPLYVIAAQYNNGSASSLNAMMKLAFYDRRFGDAELIAHERVQHYGESKAIRSYLSLLFALGDSQNAWAGIREATTRVSGFPHWRAVPVGFRVDGANVDTVHKWVIETSNFMKAPALAWYKTESLQAMTIAIQSLAMDRAAESIEALQGISKELFSGHKMKTAIPEVPLEQSERYKKATEIDRAIMEEAEYTMQAQWDVYLDRLITGYLALKRNDYKASWDAFNQHAAPSSIPPGGLNALYAGIPYHTFAAVKAGQTEAFAAYLESWSKPKLLKPGQIPHKPFPEFDVHLAKAVLAASKGSHNEAKKELLLARSTIAEPDTRPLPPEYVFAEICELLAVDSGVHDYIDIGVEWAKSYQVYEPWAAWAYAFEAKYGKTSTERVRALAMALYLDRNSARISGINANIVNQAKAWLTTNKPFPRQHSTLKPQAL